MIQFVTKFYFSFCLDFYDLFFKTPYRCQSFISNVRIFYPIASWELPLLSDSLAGALEQMSLGAKSESAVRLKLMDTHLGEIKELKKLLKDKLKLINKSI